jgi:SAM-dependent methyltransferase
MCSIGQRRTLRNIGGFAGRIEDDGCEVNAISSMIKQVEERMPTAHYDSSFDPADEKVVYTWLLRFTEGARSLLDIGCSTGFLSRHLVARGCRVVGVELDPIAAEQARSVCQRVIVGDIEAPDVQAQVDEEFDAVVLGDVLEHLRAPDALLVRIRESWLTSDGYVVLSVPNSGHWIFRREILWGRFPYRRCGLFDRTHLRFFTRASLHELVARSGYTVDRAAFTVNYNSFDDLTFAAFAALYRYYRFRSGLVKLESWLAAVLPTLFAYQFVLRIQPRCNHGERNERRPDFN